MRRIALRVASLERALAPAVCPVCGGKGVVRVIIEDEEGVDSPVPPCERCGAVGEAVRVVFADRMTPEGRERAGLAAARPG